MSHSKRRMQPYGYQFYPHVHDLDGYSYDVADVQNSIMPGCRIRNRKKKQRVFKTAERRAANKDIESQLSEV